ncbi:MAG: four helix bundle protein [Planctomycetes bacterium]|nr:four helix bundle protein [Planctomycetota bacterium]
MAEKHVRDLDAWNVSMDLVAEIYRLTTTWPKEELYALTNQIRRAAVSVPSNIAEGQGRGATREFVRFLNVSYGSLMELQTQLLIGERLGYQNRQRTEEVEQLAERTAKVINGLKRSLNKKLNEQERKSN